MEESFKLLSTMTPQEFIASLPLQIIFITQVDADENNSCIETVRGKYFAKSGLKSMIMSRDYVVQLLNLKLPIYTAGGELCDSKELKDVHFARVTLYPLGEETYITTEGNHTECDNLENLPPITFS